MRASGFPQLYISSTLFRQGFPLEFANLKYFSLILLVYYLATESNSADTKHTMTHHPALSFIITLKRLHMRLREIPFKIWEFDPPRKRLATTHVTFRTTFKLFWKFPFQQKTSKQQQRTRKGFLWNTRHAQKFPANSHFCVRIFFISRCHVASPQTSCGVCFCLSRIHFSPWGEMNAWRTKANPTVRLRGG